MINGTKIGYAKCAVDNDGNRRPSHFLFDSMSLGMILSMSRMKAGDLAAECIARGLPANGLRRDLQAAVKKARRANPSIADELKRRKALRRKQRTMRGGPLEKTTSRKPGRPPKAKLSVPSRDASDPLHIET